MAAPELKSKTLDWFDERTGWRIARDMLDHKVVPLHAGTAWYYFGGITLFLFGIQIGHRNPAAALLPAHGRRGLR